MIKLEPIIIFMVLLQESWFNENVRLLLQFALKEPGGGDHEKNDSH
jgi:hypothetical protein